jgi:hypothetical protein
MSRLADQLASSSAQNVVSIGCAQVDEAGGMVLIVMVAW